MTNRRWVLAIVTAIMLAGLTGCGIGQPMPFPEPESQLTPKPGLFTGDNGEWVIYRR